MWPVNSERARLNVKLHLNPRIIYVSGMDYHWVTPDINGYIGVQLKLICDNSGADTGIFRDN